LLNYSFIKKIRIKNASLDFTIKPFIWRYYKNRTGFRIEILGDVSQSNEQTLSIEKGYKIMFKITKILILGWG